jgi:hypothetical protein
MDYWRALGILGVDDDEGLTRTKLRRIYLRKLKDHPPERDPEGFRELREAFERARELVDDDPDLDAPSAPAVIQVIDASQALATPRADVFVPLGATPEASTPSSSASGAGSASASASASPRSTPAERIDAFIPFRVATAPSVNAFVPFSIPILGSAPVPPNENQNENPGAPYDFRPSDSRPSDSRPSDSRPSDSRPSDSRPSDSRPSDFRPSDFRPSDFRPSDFRPEQATPPIEPPRVTINPPRTETPSTKPNSAPPIEPPRILAEPPVEPPKPPPRVPPASNLPPLSTLRQPEPPLPLSVLVPKLLQLLEAGHITTALELEADWRSAGDTDDYRQADIMVAAKWSLLRELLGVAGELPAQVVKPLARALAMGKLDAAKPDLDLYRRQNQYAAEAANSLLVKKAPTIHRQIEGSLWVAPKVQVPPLYIPDPPPRTSSGRGALSGVGVFAVIGMAMVRFMASSSHTSSYDYDKYKLPDIHIPEFKPIDLSYLDHPPKFDLKPVWVPPPRPYDPVDRSPETVWASIYESSQVLALEFYGVASPEQQKAAEKFAADALEQSCRRARLSLAKLDAAPSIDALDRKTSGDEHLTAIHRWMDIVCKPKKGDKLPAKKPKPAAPAAVAPVPGLPTGQPFVPDVPPATAPQDLPPPPPSP